MGEQTQFVGFLDINTFNKQVPDGSTLKAFKMGGGTEDVIKCEDAKIIDDQPMCLVQIRNGFYVVDIGSLYL